jgi:hypothetical protein
MTQRGESVAWATLSPSPSPVEWEGSNRKGAKHAV